MTPRRSCSGLGLPSPPVWSPDGTQVRLLEERPRDTGNIRGFEHTAIWVYDVSTHSKTQITTPDDALWDVKVTEHDRTSAISSSTTAPTWSADGTKIAFVRNIVALGKDDSLYAKRGQNLWITSAIGGGAETQITHVTMEKGEKIMGGVWIPGSQDLVVSYQPPAAGIGTTPAPYLGRLNSAAGGTPRFLAGGKLMEAITDYDVSPDGEKLAYGVLGVGTGA